MCFPGGGKVYDTGKYSVANLRWQNIFNGFASVGQLLL